MIFPKRTQSELCPQCGKLRRAVGYQKQNGLWVPGNPLRSPLVSAGMPSPLGLWQPVGDECCGCGPCDCQVDGEFHVTACASGSVDCGCALMCADYNLTQIGEGCLWHYDNLPGVDCGIVHDFLEGDYTATYYVSISMAFMPAIDGSGWHVELIWDLYRCRNQGGGLFGCLGVAWWKCETPTKAIGVTACNLTNDNLPESFVATKSNWSLINLGPGVTLPADADCRFDLSPLEEVTITKA